MPAHKRSPTDIARDAIWIEEQYIRGIRNPKKIAQLMGKTNRHYKLSGDQIKKDLDKMRAAWRGRFGEQMKTAAEQTLATLDLQEAELWAAWERSKSNEHTETEKTKQMAVVQNDGIGQLMPVSETERGKKDVGQVGDPSFQRLILDIQIRRCRLLGLDRPQKMQVEHAGAIAATVDIDSLNLDLETRKKLLEAVRASNGAGRV